MLLEQEHTDLQQQIAAAQLAARTAAADAEAAAAALEEARRELAVVRTIRAVLSLRRAGVRSGMVSIGRGCVGDSAVGVQTGGGESAEAEGSGGAAAAELTSEEQRQLVIAEAKRRARSLYQRTVVSTQPSLEHSSGIGIGILLKWRRVCENDTAGRGCSGSWRPRRRDC